MNMKRLLTLVAIFATIHASAQQVNPVPDYVFRNQMSVGRNAVTDTGAYFSIGPRYGAVKGFMPPIVSDTASVNANKRNGLLIFSVQKNKFLYWDSVRVQWSDMAGSSGSYITGKGITGYVPQYTDTATLDTSALYTLGNQLGIGTSSFAYTGSGRTVVELNGTSGGLYGFKRNDSAKGYLFHNGDNMELANTVAGSISFNTNSATRGSIASDGVWRLHNLAGTGDRVVVASSNGTLSAASSATGLVDTLTISTRAWRQKGLDSLAALEVSGSGTTNYIPKFTAGSTIGNSQIFDNGTSIGISNTLPISYYKLDVDGRIRTRTQNGGLIVGFPTDTIRTISAIGNSFQTGVWLEQYSDVDNGDLFLIRGRGTVASKSNVQANDILGAIDYRGFISNTILSSASIQAKAVFIDTINKKAESDIVFTQNSSNTYTDNVIIKSLTGGMYVRGNTSIGDTAATERLDVYGKVKIRTIDSVATPINILSTNSTGVIVKSAPVLSGSGTTNYIPKYSSSTTFSISQIFDNGTNVGINDASPSDKLVVNGRMRVNGTNRITFGNNSGGYAGIGVSAATSGNLTFNTFDGVSDGERMRINASGELLISTVTDAGDYKLQVAGNIYNTGSITTGAPSGGSIKPWKIGEAATVSPTSPNRTIRVEIDGTVYYLHAKTTND